MTWGEAWNVAARRHKSNGHMYFVYRYPTRSGYGTARVTPYNLIKYANTEMSLFPNSKVLLEQIFKAQGVHNAQEPTGISTDSND